MSFMDIFNGFRQGANGGPPTSDAGGSNNGTGSGTAAGNTTVPNPSNTKLSDGSVAAFPQTSEGAKSPLENYADLWAPSKDNPSAGKLPTLSPVLNVDANKIMEVSRGLDFTKGIDPSLLEKATSGDGAALVALINGAAQNAYAQGALATTSIVRNAFTLQEDNFNKQVMPSVLRRHSISSEVSKLGIADNPATAPMLQMLEQQFSAKYPTATPTEIRTHAETYLSGFAEEIVKGQGGTILPKDNPAERNPFGLPQRKEEDWERFFGVQESSS